MPASKTDDKAAADKAAADKAAAKAAEAAETEAKAKAAVAKTAQKDDAKCVVNQASVVTKGGIVSRGEGISPDILGVDEKSETWQNLLKAKKDGKPLIVLRSEFREKGDG